MAAKSIPLKDALKRWEAIHEMKAADAVEIKLNGKYPPIDKLDPSLGTLVNCEKLSLSSNYIERLSNFQGLNKLRILSVGRNALKTCNGVESLADSLEELWMSYNNIEKLKTVASLKKLRVLYMSNNNVKDLAEVKLLSDLPCLTELVFVGNPLEEKLKQAGEYEKKMSEILPHLKKLDVLNKILGKLG